MSGASRIRAVDDGRYRRLFATTPSGVTLVYSQGKLRAMPSGLEPEYFHNEGAAFARARYLVLQHPTLRKYRFWVP